MKYVFATSLLVFIISHNSLVYANSSWRWLTSSPKELLPLAIIFTLAIEYTGILILGKLNLIKWERIKILAIIVLANIASFIFPYIVRAHTFRAISGGWVNAWKDAFTKGPYYIVLFGYLFMTLLVEVPIVYGMLKKYTLSKKILINLIVILNIITTCIVAVIERTLYHGQW
ncbi:hypothetical protein CLFO_16750 [Clostridium formicaceticum]|uniref:Uncharacterized protein n=1 Tax=Clostridium formicaceticum TaxID=1497 RepID=A0AAC9RHS9_9CLOT|nr:hypothetical protein CLFO_16750 [Clostridium formicaceticum]